MPDQTPYCVAFIFARGGSKGVPGKNVRLLGGKPLIAHSILVAKQSSYINRVIVSTDDNEIAQIAREYGADVPFMRPAELATDTSPEWLSWQHALNYLNETEKKQADIFVSLPPTSPLRSHVDVDAGIEKYLSNQAEVVISVSESHRNPYFNMVKEDANGYMSLVMETGKQVYRRQDSPVVYDMTTVVYVANPDFVLKAKALNEGRMKAVVVPKERALDIDTELDFHIAECLIQHQQSE